MGDLESDDESVDTPRISPFLGSDDESDDGEVLSELDEYRNAGIFYRNMIINSVDGNDLAFPCMIAPGWLLEEIHVTWAQLEKKRKRLRLYANYLEEKHTVRGDGDTNYKRCLNGILNMRQQMIESNFGAVAGDHSSDFKTKSSSTSLNSLLKETNNFDNSLPEFTTFSNVLFDAEYESDSSDDQSCSDEDVQEKIFSTPLFDEEIIPMKIDQRYYNAESDLMESLRTHDSSLLISSKIDSLLDDSSPRPPEEFVSANSDAEIVSFSPSPILIKDSDSLMGILILKDLTSNDTLSIPEIESFYFDIPSFSLPSTKPPDGVTGILNIEMMGDIFDQKPFMHKLMITLSSHQEKSPDLLSHRGLKAFQPSATCPMMIHRKNNHILDVLLFHFYPP
nr:hypothetical protein [Tanacetum cinerariifolium]